PSGAQNSKGARAAVRRAGSRGCRARRSGDWLSAGQRADKRSWCYFRRDDSGRGSAGRFLRGGAHQQSRAAGGRQSSDPLSRIARGGDDNPEGRAKAGVRTIRLSRLSRPPIPVIAGYVPLEEMRHVTLIIPNEGETPVVESGEVGFGLPHKLYLLPSL